MKERKMKGRGRSGVEQTKRLGEGELGLYIAYDVTDDM